MDNQHISAPTGVLINEPEPSDLAVAVSVAQKMLTAYGTVDSGSVFAYAQAHGALTESLRILLRALGSEPEIADSGKITDEAGEVFRGSPENPAAEDEAARRSVDHAFPAVAAFLAAERGEQA